MGDQLVPSPQKELVVPLGVSMSPSPFGPMSSSVGRIVYLIPVPALALSPTPSRAGMMRPSAVWPSSTGAVAAVENCARVVSLASPTGTTITRKLFDLSLPAAVIGLVVPGRCVNVAVPFVHEPVFEA